jgi:PAS domain S-box-containing protein
LGFVQEGLDFAKQALKIFEELGDKKNLAHVYNTMGFLYDHINEQENRLIVNLKSKKFSFEINDAEGMIRSLNNTGDNYIQLGNYRDALNSFKECVNLIQPTNHFMYAVVYCNIGEVNFLKKEFDEAIENFLLSLDHSRKIKSNAVEVTALLLLSKVYSTLENYDKAIELLKSGVKLFEIEQKDGKELIYLTTEDEEDSILKSSTNIQIEIYQLYAEICEKIGDIQTALWATKKTKTLEKVLSDAQHTKEFQSVHLRYEITQLEKLVAERTSELERTFQELKTKENNNRLIIENAIDAVIIFDSNGKILQHNKKTIDFFHKPNQLTEYNLRDLLSFEDGTDIDKIINKLFHPNFESFESLKFEMCDNKFTEYFQVALTRTKTENEFQGIAFIGNVTHYKIAERKRLIDLENIGEFVQIVSQQADSFTQLDLLSTIQGSGYLLTSDSAEFITSRELKSQLSIPLKVAGELIGIINCGHYIEDFFNENHIRFLMTIAPLLSNRVDKLKEQVQKELLQKELFEMNQKLEQEVNLQTKKITELTHKYLEHEKFSLLAELASSISHELNTPFGIITNGAKEVNTAISELIHCILDGELTMSSLNFALEFAKKKIEVPFTSYQNKRKYIADIKEYLLSKNIEDERSFELAQVFVNAKFTINDEDEINFVLKTEKQNELLNIIYYIEKTLLLSNSIIETSNSASLIVQELTKIAIGSKTYDITKFNLLENINSVLAVYKFKFDAISIQLNVHGNIEISANEINLFQLWKNAFMLASNLFEETEVDKYIRIKSEIRESNILIEFSFNGRKISDEIIANILDVTPIMESSNKVIIRKLSMIKKIITDHKGRLSILSNENTFLYIELPYTFSSI